MRKWSCKNMEGANSHLRITYKHRHFCPGNSARLKTRGFSTMLSTALKFILKHNLNDAAKIKVP